MRRLALLALALVAARCTTPLPEATISSVIPSRGPDNLNAVIRIAGGFSPRLETDFAEPSSSRLDRTHRVLLGTTLLLNVKLESDGTLTATVPAGMVPGSYDLTVRDPWGHEVKKSSAYEVISSYQLAQSVAGYRVAAIGAQRSYDPFAITVEAIDSSGEVVTTFDGEVDLSDVPGHVEPHRLGGFIHGQWTGQVEIRGAVTSDALTVTDDSGRIGRSNTFAVGTRDPAELRYATSALSVAAGACSSPVTVTLFDEFGDPSPTVTPLALGLALSPAGSSGVFADAACTVPLGGPQVPAASDRVTLYLRGTLAGPLSIDLSASTLADAAQTETVLPGAPASVAFVSGSQTVAAGSCSGAASVQLLDAFGNVTSAPAGTTATLAASSGTVALYDGPGCSGTSGQASFAPGATQSSFSFRGQLAAGVTVTVGGAGLASADQPQTIVAAPPSAWGFTSAAQTVRAGACSGQVAVQSLDGFGNPSALTGPTTLALAAPGLSFFDDPACSSPISSIALAAGDGGATFYVSGTLASTPLLTVSGGVLAPATQSEQVTPADPDRLVYVTSSRSAVAGQCSLALTLEARDPYGNVSAPASAVAVLLSSSPSAGISLFTDASCASGAVMQASLSGSTVSLYFRGTPVGSYSVQGQVSGWSAAAQAETVTPAAPDHLVFATAPQGIVAGTCSGAVTLETHDPFGNLAPVAGTTSLALSGSPASGFSLYADASCTTPVGTVGLSAGQSSGTFFFAGTLAGAVDVSASGPGLASVDQTETLQSAAPSQLVFTSAPQTLVAGGCSSAATLQSEDPFGNPSAPGTDQTVALAGPAGVGFFSDSACSTSVSQVLLGAGTLTTGFYFRPTLVPAATLTASIAGWTSASQDETVQPGGATALQWDPVPALVSTNAPEVVTVRAIDGFGNVDTAFASTATLSIAPAGSVSCGANCTSANETAAFSAGLWSGEVDFGLPSGSGRTLTATSGTLTGTSNPFDVQSISTDPPPLARFTFQPAVILAGQTVSFDASGSTDNVTPSASLKVSWDFSGASTSPPPWTPFTTTKTATRTFNTAGTYGVVLAVLDGNGGIGYVSHQIQVLDSMNDTCVVNTTAAADDGASSCSGPFGTDGKLSWREAVRLSNSLAGKQTITFSGPMTINPNVAGLNLTDDVDIYAPSGVILQSTSVSPQASVLISNLEFDGDGANTTVNPSGHLTDIDVTYNNTKGVTVQGSASFDRTLFTACRTDCIHFDSGNTPNTLSVRFSQFTNTNQPGVDVKNCGGATVDLQSNLFDHVTNTGFFFEPPTGTVLLRNNTFDSDATAAKFNSGSGHVVRNNVFSNSTASAMVCGKAAIFASRDHHLLFGNKSDGCAAGDPNTILGDPSYVSAATGDYRLLYQSPARDTAVDLGLDVNREAPGLLFGTAPDRGGRESF